MLGESGLALDEEKQPDRAGFLTPATVSARLAERLREAGQSSRGLGGLSRSGGLSISGAAALRSGAKVRIRRRGALWLRAADPPHRTR